jgi:DNA-binding CsgD family transcriptional regulator
MGVRKSNKRDVFDKPEKVAYILSEYIAGNTIKVIAQNMGISEPTVGNIIKKNGLNKGVSKLSDVEYELIANLYKEGKSQKELSEQFCVSRSRINGILRTKGVERNHDKARYVCNKPNMVKYIIESYVNNKPTTTIAKDLNIDITTVNVILKKNNINIRPMTESHRKYFLNKNWLDSIDSEDKAYFLGLMWTDGNVSSNLTRITLSFKEDDKYILEYFSKIFYLGLNKVVTRVSDRIIDKGKYHITERSSFLYIYSVEMAKKLMNMGCMPNKTFHTRFPQWLNKNLWPHFIRGLIDGDGCISISCRQPSVSFTGTIELIDDLEKIFIEELGFTNLFRYINNKESNNNIYNFHINRFEDIKKFLDWIYKDSTIHFVRKYDKYNGFLEKYNNYIQKKLKRSNYKNSSILDCET